MISIESLKNCLSNLALLHSKLYGKREKALLLEIGCVLQREIDFQNGLVTNKSNIELDAQKLLEDNRQLYQENKTLIETTEKLKSLFEQALPSIQAKLQIIEEKFDTLNEDIKAL